MKSIFMGLALVLAGSNAFANVTVLASRVQTAVVNSGVRSAINLSKYTGAAALVVAPAIMTQLEAVTAKVESVSKDNDDSFNGLSKQDRIDALQLIFASLVTSGKDASVSSIASGDVLKMATEPVKEGKLDVAQFGQLTTFLQLAADGVAVDEAAQKATGIKTTTAAELASKCGAAGRR